MVDRDNRLKAAILRQDIREIDAKVRAINADQRLFRRFNFDLDVQEIQLAALQNERADLLDDLQRARTEAARRGAPSGGLRSWLVLPFALGALAIQAIRPGRRQPRRGPPPYPTHSLKPLPSHSVS